MGIGDYLNIFYLILFNLILMEVNIINDIKKRSSSKSKKEEASSLIKEDSIVKVKNIDINKTVKEFKDKIYDTLNLSTQLPKNKLGIMLSIKKEGKEIKTFLSDDFKKLSFYEGVTDPDALFHLKDIGAQINYRLVYILEYLGPLLFSLFFFIRYYNVYKKNNPEKDLQVHVICYFLMIILHYSKRIYESIFVHIFSRTTMPLTNLYKNCAYYWGIFGILCEYSLFNPYQEDFTYIKVLRYFFILWFVSGELANYKTHMILREIKLTKDHNGSRIVQKFLDEFSEEEIEKFLEKIKEEIISLSKDIFGNYVIQKILETKPEKSINIIFNSLKNNFYDLSKNIYGCRVVQKLLDLIPKENISQIFKELKNHLFKCIEDQNGNHVIQKLIEKINPEEQKILLNNILKRIYDLCMHQYGCRVIQKLLYLSDNEEKLRIKKEILKYILDFFQDQKETEKKNDKEE